MFDPEPIKASLQVLNEHLRAAGLLEILLVKPSECVAQRINARYFSPEIMQQLTNNIADAGNLESMPLVYVEDGVYKIISGHHRIEAAVAAKLPWILVLRALPKSHDEVVSMQIAHNALVGIDDKVILSEMFQSIQDIQLRLRTGLNDELAKITYTSLNFRIGEFRELTLLFLPEQLGELESDLEMIARNTSVRPQTTVMLADRSDFDTFTKVLRRIKRTENIKNNATAILRMAQLAMEHLNADRA